MASLILNLSSCGLNKEQQSVSALQKGPLEFPVSFVTAVQHDAEKLANREYLVHFHLRSASLQSTYTHSQERRMKTQNKPRFSGLSTFMAKYVIFRLWFYPFFVVLTKSNNLFLRCRKGPLYFQLTAVQQDAGKLANSAYRVHFQLHSAWLQSAYNTPRRDEWKRKINQDFFGLSTLSRLRLWFESIPLTVWFTYRLSQMIDKRVYLEWKSISIKSILVEKGESPTSAQLVNKSGI